jgi:hypothetical protein
MFKTWLQVLLCCFFFQIISIAQLDDARRITKRLCSEEFFGRGYVKKGDSLAARFIGEEFQTMGLIPLKNNSFFQSFKHSVTTFPREMVVVIDNDTLLPGVDYLVDPNSGSSKLNWRYKELSVEELFDPSLFQKYVSNREKEQAGITSVLVDLSSYKGDSLKRLKIDIIPNLAQQLDVVVLTSEKLTHSVGNEPFQYSLIYLNAAKFKPGQSIYTHIYSKFEPEHYSTNVIGMVPAHPTKKRFFEKKQPPQTLFITAHYDHLGGMGNSTYFPGANDNASGVAMLLDLARYFQQHPTKYNLVFIAFAGEELGLLGSRYFVNYPWVDLTTVRFLLNLDIMGSGEEGITVVNGKKHTEEFQRLLTWNAKADVPTIQSRGEAANSDHYWFSQVGVPAFFAYTMGPNKHYHDIYDTYEQLSFSKFEPLSELFRRFLESF